MSKMITVEIKGFTIVNQSYVKYEILVTHGFHSYSIHRRFNDFKKLVEDCKVHDSKKSHILASRGQECRLPDLPSHGFHQIFNCNKFKEAFLTQRMVDLERFLKVRKPRPIRSSSTLTLE